MKAHQNQPEQSLKFTPHGNVVHVQFHALTSAQHGNWIKNAILTKSILTPLHVSITITPFGGIYEQTGEDLCRDKRSLSP
jgi:hypothetical protein